MDKPCLNCGKTFYAKRPDMQHCSEKCRRPPLSAVCDHCGETYHTMKCWIEAGRRFCSFGCYQLSTGETPLERDVRLILDGLGVEYRQEAQVGRWSVDFLLPEQRLAIEADGAYWHTNVSRDQVRDGKLRALGTRVVRIKEAEVKDGTATDRIREAIERRNLVLNL